MIFTLQSSALALLVCLSSTLAFAPNTTPAKAWGIKSQPVLRMADLNLDTNFDEVSIVRLLGLKRVKNIIRKNKVIYETSLKVSSAGTAEDSAPAPAAKSGLKLIIAGAPASGKGTQCEIIKKEYGVVHLSTGDMLRAAVAEGTEVGKQAKAFMDAGKLVPDEVIIGVVSKFCQETIDTNSVQ